MRLTLGISSCPNDTFVFDALIHGKVDTEGLSFGLVVSDVEDLNRKALSAHCDISKISYSVYPLISDNYMLMNSGSALGRGNGPMVVGKTLFPREVFTDLRIAIPGKNTTANLLFTIFFPDATKKTEYLFSEIENAILNEEADAGVIIHESRFTYQEKGLLKIADLGEMWELSTGNPIPLGGIVGKRDLGDEVLMKIDRVIRRSVEFAFHHPDSSRSFVKQYASDLDDRVIDQHINLYVNGFTASLGSEGEQAVRELFGNAHRVGLIPLLPVEIFVHKYAN